MKLRRGFVSNSSSSSFMLSLKDITEEQRTEIHNHLKVAQDNRKKFALATASLGHGPDVFCDSVFDAWDIKEYDDKMVGTTFMNNFDMEAFLIMIGVPNDKFEYEVDD